MKVVNGHLFIWVFIAFRSVGICAQEVEKSKEYVFTFSASYIGGLVLIFKK